MCQLFSEPNAGSDLASATHARGARRRRVGGQRSEGVDVERARRRRRAGGVPHRSRRPEAPRAHHVPGRHARAGRRGATAAPDDGERQLQRGVPHRRARARLASRRRAEQGLRRDPHDARQRAEHRHRAPVVGPRHRAVRAAAPGRRRLRRSSRPARSGQRLAQLYIARSDQGAPDRAVARGVEAGDDAGPRDVDPEAAQPPSTTSSSCTCSPRCSGPRLAADTGDVGCVRVERVRALDARRCASAAAPRRSCGTRWRRRCSASRRSPRPSGDFDGPRRASRTHSCPTIPGASSTITSRRMRPRRHWSASRDPGGCHPRPGWATSNPRRRDWQGAVARGLSLSY